MKGGNILQGLLAAIKAGAPVLPLSPLWPVYYKAKESLVKPAYQKKTFIEVRQILWKPCSKKGLLQICIWHHIMLVVLYLRECLRARKYENPHLNV